MRILPNFIYAIMPAYAITFALFYWAFAGWSPIDPLASITVTLSLFALVAPPAMRDRITKSNIRVGIFIIIEFLYIFTSSIYLVRRVDEAGDLFEKPDVIHLIGVLFAVALTMDVVIGRFMANRDISA